MSYENSFFQRNLLSFLVHSTIGIIYLIIFYGFFGLSKVLVKFIRLGAKRFFRRVSRPKPSEIGLDPIYGTHHMIKLKSSGISLHYVSKGFPNQQMILFIHGFPECWYSWRHQMKHFSKEYRVVAIDLRGYGLSSKCSSFKDYQIQALTQDVADLIEQLGYEACDIVGHGTGGTIAWFTAMLFPNLVERLVVLNSPHPSTLFNDSTFEQVRSSWEIYFNQIPFFPELDFAADDFSKLDEILRGKQKGLINPEKITDEDLEIYKYTFSQPGSTKAAFDHFRSFLLDRPNDYVNQLGSPVLLIWGSRNSIVDEKLCESSLKYHDQIEIRKIPWASNWPHEDAPDAVNIYIELFFKQHNEIAADFDY